jgi:hypothetical protein
MRVTQRLSQVRISPKNREDASSNLLMLFARGRPRAPGKACTIAQCKIPTSEVHALSNHSRLRFAKPKRNFRRSAECTKCELRSTTETCFHGATQDWSSGGRGFVVHLTSSVPCKCLLELLRFCHRRTPTNVSTCSRTKRDNRAIFFYASVSKNSQHLRTRAGERASYQAIPR